MRRLLLTVFIALHTGVLAAAQDPFRLRVDVPIVSVNVYVDDITGKPITNLTREDFIVLEDGAEREITNFASAETPYNLLLLFDRSSSTRNQWPFLTQAVGRLMEALSPVDRMAVAAFDSKPEMVLDWKNAGARQRFTMRFGGSGTDMYRAIEWSAGQLRNLKGRKGVLVFTDGIDDRLARTSVRFDANGDAKIPPPSEDRDFGKVLETIMRTSTPFYFIAVNTDVNSGPDILTTGFELQMRTQARLRMELMADRSNGRIYFPKTLEDVGHLYEQIGRELGNSYSIGFRPGDTANDGKFHPFEIRARNANLRVTQSRAGYSAQQP